MNISFFEKITATTATEVINFKDYLNSIKLGKWQDVVLNYRAERIDKKLIPACTPCGTFNERKSDKIIEHSGFICIDIDAKDQFCEIDIEKLRNDKYTYAAHTSVGGYGYAIYVRIDKLKHLDAFMGLEKHYFDSYSIVVDKSCKDTSRLRFVSYDPDLYLNEKSITFKDYVKKIEQKKLNYPKQIFVKTDFESLCHQAGPLNLFDDYNDYLRLIFALTSEFGENGRGYFHLLAQASNKYNIDIADNHYSKGLNRNKTGVSIGYVYFMFKEAGLAIKSEKTTQLISIAKLADNPKLKIKELGIEDAENILGKIENKKETTVIDEVIELIKLSNIKFNEITRNFEFDKIPMNDRILAEFYQKVWQRIDEDFPSNKIFSLIQSRINTPSYNPIHDWFTANKNLKTNNEFQKLKDCFVIKHMAFIEDVEHEVDDYFDVFVKKWLLGIIGSAYGTYSLMILVLNGEQNTNKTEFFRNLLPNGLQKFYAENNLDDGKDSEILMTKKLLIVDDEFGGKTKKDATKLKRLSSQQTFSIRMPYGRVSEDLNRLAVLGGTSNDSEVINDTTGNRRIIPLNIISIDLEKYKAINKDLLFIELYNEWDANKSGWFLTKEEIGWLNKSTEINTEIMSEVEILNSYFEKYEYGNMTCTDVKIELEKINPQIKTSTKKIGQALKLSGYSQFIKKINGKTCKIYKISISTKNV